MKNFNFVAGMTRRFVSAKRLIRYFPNSSKLVEHRAQSPVREVKMEFAGIRKVSDESLGRDEMPRHTSHEIKILHKYLTIFYYQFNFGLASQTFGLVTLSNSLPEGQPYPFIFVSPCMYNQITLDTCAHH